ncbi:MAG: single-stranded DNA-binding protein [Calditrichota bacterium]
MISSPYTLFCGVSLAAQRDGMLATDARSGVVKATMKHNPKTGENNMANNNTVILIGNLGEDPKTYHNDKGNYVVIRLATTDSYKDEDLGAYVNKEPVWHSVFAFGSNVQGYARNFKKGDRIKITGSLSYRKHQLVDQDGVVQYFTEASITASRVERADLPKKAPNAAQSDAAETAGVAA